MTGQRDKLKNVKTFDELLDVKYGVIGTKKRDVFEFRSKSLMIGELLKEARSYAKMTQDDLARKTGTKKSYISRVENGKIDIQLSTLFRIFEDGLGRQVNLSIV
jgi:HTH-type transcriptional regulator / antitoxin HipB